MSAQESSDTRYLLVTPLSPVGEAAATQVCFVAQGDDVLLVLPAADATSLQQAELVQLAPCSVRGRVTGPGAVAAVSRLDPAATAAVSQRLGARYGMVVQAMLKQVEEPVGIRLRATPEGHIEAA